MIFKNVKIFTMKSNQEIIDNGYLVVENGKVSKVGCMSQFPFLEDGIDLTGKLIFPGFIDAHCHIGMMEDGLDFEGDDLNEDTDPVTPQLRAIDSINPLENSFKEAYEAGVTTVVTGPGSSNVIAGSFVAMKTYGICVDDMIVKDNCAMKFAFGENPKNCYNSKNQTPITRMASIALIREQLYKAKEYLEKLEEYESNPSEYDKPEYDIKCQSLLSLLRGEIPMKVHAHRADDMLSAVRIAKEFNLNLTLDHCTEGHLIKEKLKELNYPCLVGPSLCERSKPELKNLTYKTPKILSEQGLDVSIITDHPVIPMKYLILCAALAHKEGMDYISALKAITINPAKALLIDDKVGSIEQGKDADLVIFDGDPFELKSRILEVYINGEQVYVNET